LGLRWPGIRLAYGALCLKNANPANVNNSLALSGVRVVELGRGVAAAFAAKLMALMGAAVIAAF
jgi:glutamate dehydrogenase/leucine dehydrogenase